jgi:transcriptional regulator of NAD metabolism
MDGAQRRAAIVGALQQESPVTGSSLASRLGVTRQVIVQDMAVLRAQGQRIMATPKGYTMVEEAPAPGFTRLLAVKHDRDQTQDELYTMVDQGAEVLDVIVEHPVYGQLTGLLALRSRADVDQFLKTMDQTHAGLLSSLTKGVHLHSVRCKDEDQFPGLLEALAAKGYLLTE